MTVVPVLITSCQVSEKWNIGPVIAHPIIRKQARIKAIGRPVAQVTADENFSKTRDILFFIQKWV
jgi:hypothetical protein